MIQYFTKKWLQALLASIVVCVVYLFSCGQDPEYRFSVSAIKSTTPNRLEWDSAIKLPEGAFSQPYFLAGRGYLSYRFNSQDKAFCLSFIRHPRLVKQKMREQKLYASYMLAWELLKEETGLISLHLNKTKERDNVTLFDANKRAHEIDVNATQYLLQYRAANVKETIEQRMLEGKQEAAKACLDKIISLLVSCSNKGIVNTYGFSRNKMNIGLFNERAIFLDCGGFRFKPKSKVRSLLVKNYKVLRPINKWLMLHYPELSIYLHEKMKDEYMRCKK